MPAGEAFSAHENYEIQHAVDNATRVARLPISVFVGSAESQARPYAERLHASLADPGNSVLIFVDPGARRLEIVTGSRVTNIVTDADCALVAMAMQTSFAAGDLSGGLVSGVQQLGDRISSSKVVHADPG